LSQIETETKTAMANETHLDTRSVFEDEPHIGPAKPQSVTTSWGSIRAKPSDRIFEPAVKRPKSISSLQIALELIVAALILLLFL